MLVLVVLLGTTLLLEGRVLLQGNSGNTASVAASRSLRECLKERIAQLNRVDHREAEEAGRRGPLLARTSQSARSKSQTGTWP